MLKRILMLATLTLLVTMTAVASDREDDVNRTHKAAQVFQEIMNAPDQGIPTDLLESAKCIAIIPGDVKFAFIFGANYGRGLATCRTGHGWSAPMSVSYTHLDVYKRQRSYMVIVCQLRARPERLAALKKRG